MPCRAEAAWQPQVCYSLPAHYVGHRVTTCRKLAVLIAGADACENTWHTLHMPAALQWPGWVQASAAAALGLQPAVAALPSLTFAGVPQREY